MQRQSCRHKVQLLITAAWTSLCVVLILQHSKALDKRHVQLLWTYFQPLGPPLLMLWLWAQAVAHFEQRHIAFEACFPESERRWLAPSKDIYSACMVLTWLVFGGLALCSTLCAAAAAAPGVPASQPPLAPLLVPPLLYLSLAFVLLLPANVMRKQSRMFFARTVLKVLVPLQPVGWADFLLADMLTSLAKSSSDVTRSVCLMLHGPLAHPLHPYSATAASSCGYLTLGSLAALVLPFATRMLQCISVWRAGGPRSQLFNALKYASSLPALILTAFEHEHHVHKQLFAWKRLWVVTMLLNSCYSFYWDVEQDWDMPWVMQYGGRKFGPLRLPALKGSHTYSSGWYAWLLLSNLLLRFTWAHRLLGDLEAHNEVLLAVALLEVLRRWQWVFVRVESETRKLGLLTSQLEDGLVTSKSGDVMVLANGAAQHAAAVAAGHGASRGASSDGVAFGGDRADVKMHLHGLLRGHVHAHANSLQEGAAVAVPLLKA